jgi:hypothetical protein
MDENDIKAEIEYEICQLLSEYYNSKKESDVIER